MPMEMHDPETLAQYRAATEAAALFDLSDHGKIELTGVDARSFLQNLCTQDVKSLPVGATCEAFLTTNKARVVAHVWVTPTAADVLRLDMIAGQAEKVFKHLNHYLISEKVELADRTHELAMSRLVGPQAADRLRSVLPAFATDTSVRQHRLLALDGFDLFCPAAEAVALRQRLVEAGFIVAGPTTYQLLRVEAGLPEYGSDIDENRLAMETGRTSQAISYAKGCYLGQETIVMARDRGQVNRLLMGVKMIEGPVITPGAKVFRADDEIGQVTSSVHSPGLGQVIALAYLRRGSWDAGTEVVIEGRSGVVCALPFRAGA